MKKLEDVFKSGEEIHRVFGFVLVLAEEDYLRRAAGWAGQMFEILDLLTLR